MNQSTLYNLQDLGAAIWRNKIWGLSFSLLCGLLAAIYARTTPERHEAYSKIFPLSFSKSSSSPVDAIKAQFGMSDKTDYSIIYNILELVNSKTVSTRIARSPITHPKYKTLTDWLIADYNANLHFRQKAIKLRPSDSLEKFIVGSDLVKSSIEIINEKTEFTRIITRAHEKNLARLINALVIKHLSDYYIEVSTEKARRDLVKIGSMRDSLRNELGNLEGAIASFQDANQLSVKYSVGIPQARMARSRAELEQIYATTVTAYQNAQFKLLSESPIFQVLDEPSAPFISLKPSWIKYGAISFMIGLFLSCLVLSRKVLLRMMTDELSKA